MRGDREQQHAIHITNVINMQKEREYRLTLTHIHSRRLAVRGGCPLRAMTASDEGRKRAPIRCTHGQRHKYAEGKMAKECWTGRRGAMAEGRQCGLTVTGGRVLSVAKVDECVCVGAEFLEGIQFSAVWSGWVLLQVCCAVLRVEGTVLPLSAGIACRLWRTQYGGSSFQPNQSVLYPRSVSPLDLCGNGDTGDTRIASIR
jgi:hypothetical protein